jgi:uncharacterized lipoprotein YajG
MKKYLAIIFLLAACGGKETKKSTDTSDTTKAKTDTVKTVTIDTTGTSDSSDLAIISKNPYKLGNIEVASADLPESFTWDMAKGRAKSLGSGWRIPNDKELNEIYKNKNAIGGFASDVYWSSDEKDMMNAHIVNFSNGKEGSFSKVYNARTRVVRSL